MPPRLIGFTPQEEEMLCRALTALKGCCGYEVDLFQELIRVEMPPGYRGMSLDEGAALGSEAFVSQEWLNHVLEEEYLHLLQKAEGAATTFGPETVLELERDVNERRRFPRPFG